MERHRRRRAIRVFDRGRVHRHRRVNRHPRPHGQPRRRHGAALSRDVHGIHRRLLWRLDARGERRETIIDAASSDTACLEIGGGPWIAPYRASAEIRRRSALSWVSRWTSPPSPTSSRLSAISSRVSDARSRHRLTTPFTPSRVAPRLAAADCKTPNRRKAQKVQKYPTQRRARVSPSPSPLSARRPSAPRVFIALTAPRPMTSMSPRASVTSCASSARPSPPPVRASADCPTGACFCAEGRRPGNASRRR